MKFPEGFLWGAATAAHQVEGNNLNSDLWLLEHVAGSPFVEPSGDACDHYHRYHQDLDLLAALGFNAYRFSLEWARIEPERGHFSRAELEHYRRMLAHCRGRGLTPVVTLHHFTSPRWVAAAGGWEAAETARRFAEYCDRVGAYLGDLIGVACTINEVNLAEVLRQAGFVGDDGLLVDAPWRVAAARALGVEPGNFSSFPFCVRRHCREVMLEAHRLGVAALRARGTFPVGMTLALRDMQAAPGGEGWRDQAREEAEDIFLAAARGDDFIGVQCYTRQRYGTEGPLAPAPDAEFTQMGYEFCPEALEAAIRHAAALSQLPVMVTENGVALADDQRRTEYVSRALQGVGRCLQDGVDVRGYFYWSLLDNYEWIYGYHPKFGLVAVDRLTQRRTVKASAKWLGAIARANRI